ncbi:hypothetical protein [Streptomyces aurantiogriseus]|uniref:Uncharacterized protein n=1 Tax=Streptomyces aurantiogriseus TaxID=66870 RepID=A0A918F2M4_9ACTN|nr:hypothetical protein [Streptomyces aurantiogriseus]GGQ95907.1 hypothetical protein GCM10010251_08220 [Streptomyces aurantiogriseus]
MPHVTAYRRKARLIDHAAPPTPQEWLEHDARYFEDVVAEIQRRAAGGDPGEAPWASPLYFDTAERDESAVGRALLALRHLPAGAVARLAVLSRMFQGENIRPEAGPVAERNEETDAGTDGGLPARARRKEGTVGPAVRAGRTLVTPLDSAEALAG